MQSAIPKISSGGGRIRLTGYGSNAVLSELSSTYPLKLLSPRIPYRGVSVVYLLTYGGGLVGGDRIDLSVDVDTNTSLVLLSQGSTKVFKDRPGQRLASVRGSQPPLSPDGAVTTQNMTFKVASEGGLYLLPEPVTCFESASYNQTQTFQLSKNASIVILDWLTSGRMSMGEEWAFTRYYSANEVRVEGRRIAKDVTLLDMQGSNCQRPEVPTRKLGDRLAPYSCYGMLILYGPQVEATIKRITALYDDIRVFKANSPADMVWSLSHMTSALCGEGAIVRIAGKETEVVKKWLSQILMGLEDIVGNDVYRKAFA